MTKSVLGIDVGRQGSFCLLNADASKMLFWDMPITAGAICGVGIANIYKAVQKLCKTPPLVFVEKIFTMPTDAISQTAYDQARAICVTLKNKGEVTGEIPDLPPVRLDGRVGNLNYAKGAGLLEMCHLWGWSVTLVSPKTWVALQHKGLPKDLPAKERSLLYMKQRWPHLYEPGSIVWPERMKAPHLGRLDALMIAEYGLKIQLP